MSRRRSKTRPDSLGGRFVQVLVPGTTGGMYTLLPGAFGFLVVVGLYIHSYFSGRLMPVMTGEILTASVTMLGVHTVRSTLADRANAANGLGPVPVAEPAGETGAASAGLDDQLPDPRPRD